MKKDFVIVKEGIPTGFFSIKDDAVKALEEFVLKDKTIEAGFIKENERKS